ncbi:MAG: hypothetical protein ACK5Y2_05695 [Bdellovibrionales bacterium]
MKNWKQIALILVCSSGLAWAQENTTEIATGPENANSDQADNPNEPSAPRIACGVIR